MKFTIEISAAQYEGIKNYLFETDGSGNKICQRRAIKLLSLPDSGLRIGLTISLNPFKSLTLILISYDQSTKHFRLR